MNVNRCNEWFFKEKQEQMNEWMNSIRSKWRCDHGTSTVAIQKKFSQKSSSEKFCKIQSKTLVS